MTILSNQRIAIVVPCYNEALTIAAIVRDFNACLPDAPVYVFDNNSTDDTVRVALAAGAIVRKVPLQGKGNVIRRMFADAEADVYLMVDGDGTYDATVAPQLADKLVSEGLVMVGGTGVST